MKVFETCALERKVLVNARGGSKRRTWSNEDAEKGGKMQRIGRRDVIKPRYYR